MKKDKIVHPRMIILIALQWGKLGSGEIYHWVNNECNNLVFYDRKELYDGMEWLIRNNFVVVDSEETIGVTKLVRHIYRITDEGRSLLVAGREVLKTLFTVPPARLRDELGLLEKNPAKASHNNQ